MQRAPCEFHLSLPLPLEGMPLLIRVEKRVVTLRSFTVAGGWGHVRGQVLCAGADNRTHETRTTTPRVVCVTLQLTQSQTSGADSSKLPGHGLQTQFCRTQSDSLITSNYWSQIFHPQTTFPVSHVIGHQTTFPHTHTHARPCKTINYISTEKNELPQAGLEPAY